MPKGRKLSSPSDDPDMRAMTKRLAARAQRINDTPINDASAATSSDPADMVVSGVATRHASSKPAPAAEARVASFKLDGRLKVSQSFDDEVVAFAKARNERPEVLRAVLIKSARRLLTTDIVLQDAGLKAAATSLFDAPGTILWKRYNYRLTHDVINRCHVLCGDTGKRLPNRAYAAALSAALAPALADLTRTIAGQVVSTV